MFLVLSRDNFYVMFADVYCFPFENVPCPYINMSDSKDSISSLKPLINRVATINKNNGISPSVDLLCFYHSILFRLLGQSGCSSPSTKELLGCGDTHS